MSVAHRHAPVRLDPEWLARFAYVAPAEPDPTIPHYVSTRNPHGSEQLAALLVEIDRRYPDDSPRQVLARARAYKPRGGPCAFCGEAVPATSRYARFCCDSCERYYRRTGAAVDSVTKLPMRTEPR